MESTPAVARRETRAPNARSSMPSSVVGVRGKALRPRNMEGLLGMGCFITS